ncbi:glucosamine inositolphosphorylceramide transferase family protein [Providencia heimbachae]|uniref:Glucosamine inositolphosphorylceramide transferase 1 N-terminal domain-containing protein n=1 Tax=Providencia heimbachae ATCC 35613 TaxID=1354272 RepID=A0A1B7JUV5_9GAMM|nr:hypothetical protein [Providencia heimbachae]OAT51690.1 hypothetical protein M998_2036 [Providencia heimbachae ATCC 35613]SQH15813.1 Uncharacterised protein [Providencia heimbachae]
MSVDIIKKKYNSFCKASNSNLKNDISISINDDIFFSLSSNNKKIKHVTINSAELTGKKLITNHNKLCVAYTVIFNDQTVSEFEVKRRIIKRNINYFFDSFALELFFILNSNLKIDTQNKKQKIENRKFQLPKKDIGNIFLNIYNKIINRFFRRDEWMIAYYEKNIQPHEVAKEFNNFTVLQNRKNQFSADPFIIENDKGSYIFFEECPLKKGGKGILVCYDLNTDTSQTIIEEDYHLSYPNVFKIENNYFMIPQSENHCIDLYQAIQFPYQWEKCHTILKHGIFNFGDTNIYFNKNGKIQITTSAYDHVFNSNRLRIGWEIDNLFKSKININNSELLSMSDESSRNAGNHTDLTLFQECSSGYGGGLVQKNENNMTHIERPKNFIGMHTYNSSANYTVIDIKKIRYGIYF